MTTTTIVIGILSFFLGALLSFVGSMIYHITKCNEMTGYYDDIIKEISDENKQQKQPVFRPIPIEEVPQEIKDMLKGAISDLEEEEYKNSPFYNLSLIREFKEETNRILIDCVENEQFEKSARLKELLNNTDSWFKERREWFESMIGKTIYLKSSDCDCVTCKRLISEGVELTSKEKAMSFFAYENLNKIKGDYNKVFVDSLL